MKVFSTKNDQKSADYDLFRKKININKTHITYCKYYYEYPPINLNFGLIEG